jgi:putative sterol carrier protein
VFLFDLAGENGGKWAVRVRANQVTVEEVAEGEDASPDVTLSMAAEDLLAIANGTLNPVAAFMQGRVRVSGDMGLAMRMQSILT